MEPARAILLPGAVLPADLAYGDLVAALGDGVEAVPKDLEVYAGDSPPDGYGLAHEVAGVLREADERGFDHFHLVGYSGGGAAALAFAAAQPGRLLSLALLEPAWAGRWELSAAEQDSLREFERIRDLPPERFMPAFVRLQLRPGVEPPPPPPGPPPPWMATRPAGIKAFLGCFESAELDPAALAAFERPVLYVLGGRSNQDHYRGIADRLARTFPDFRLELFEERHHFDPPHRAEPERLAACLHALWGRD